MFSLLNGRRSLLMDLAGAGWLVIAPVGFHHAVPVVHVPRSNPVGKAAIRASLIATFRRHVEIPVSPEELLAAATKSRICVEDLTGVVLEEDAVAAKVF